VYCDAVGLKKLSLLINGLLRKDIEIAQRVII
jgi:hypothetical protein